MNPKPFAHWTRSARSLAVAACGLLCALPALAEVPPDVQEVEDLISPPADAYQRIILGDGRLWDWRGSLLNFDVGNLTHDPAAFRQPLDFFVDPDQDTVVNRLWVRELDVNELWFRKGWDKNRVHTGLPLLDPSSEIINPINSGEYTLMEDADAWRLTLGDPELHPDVTNAVHWQDRVEGAPLTDRRYYLGLRTFLPSDFQGSIRNLAPPLNQPYVNSFNLGHETADWPAPDADGRRHSGAVEVLDNLEVRGIFNLTQGPYVYGDWVACSVGYLPMPSAWSLEVPSKCSGYLTSFRVPEDQPFEPEAGEHRGNPVQVRDPHGFEVVVPRRFTSAADNASFGQPMAYFDVKKHRARLTAFNWPGDADQTEPNDQPWEYDLVLGNGYWGFQDVVRDVKLHTKDLLVRAATLETGGRLKPYGITLGAQGDARVTGEDVDNTLYSGYPTDAGVSDYFRGERRVAWPFGATKVVRNVVTSSADSVTIGVACPYSALGDYDQYRQPYWALTGCDQRVENAAQAAPRGVRPFRLFAGDTDSNPFNDWWWYSKPADQMWVETTHMAPLTLESYPPNTVGCRATFANPLRENATFMVFAHCSDSGRRKVAPGGVLVPSGMEHIAR